MTSSYFWIYMIILLLCIILPAHFARRRRLRLLKKRKQRGERNNMTLKLLTECIGKKVELYGEGGISGYSGTVLAVEENLLTVEHIRVILLV